MKLSYLCESNKYYYGSDTVVILKDNGNSAFVKIIDSKRYKAGARLELPWNELSQQPPRRPQPRASFSDQCPGCGTPGHIPGIECPGCGNR